jgi:hypothetical protein
VEEISDRQLSYLQGRSVGCIIFNLCGAVIIFLETGSFGTYALFICGCNIHGFQIFWKRVLQYFTHLGDNLSSISPREVLVS